MLFSFQTGVIYCLVLFFTLNSAEIIILHFILQMRIFWRPGWHSLPSSTLFHGNFSPSFGNLRVSHLCLRDQLITHSAVPGSCQPWFSFPLHTVKYTSPGLGQGTKAWPAELSIGGITLFSLLSCPKTVALSCHRQVAKVGSCCLHASQYPVRYQMLEGKNIPSHFQVH